MFKIKNIKNPLLRWTLRGSWWLFAGFFLTIVAIIVLIFLVAEPEAAGVLGGLLVYSLYESYCRRRAMKKAIEQWELEQGPPGLYEEGVQPSGPLYEQFMAKYREFYEFRKKDVRRRTCGEAHHCRTCHYVYDIQTWWNFRNKEKQCWSTCNKYFPHNPQDDPPIPNPWAFWNEQSQGLVPAPPDWDTEKYLWDCFEFGGPDGHLLVPNDREAIQRYGLDYWKFHRNKAWELGEKFLLYPEYATPAELVGNRSVKELA